MLELNQCGPQTPSGIVNLKRGLNHFFSLGEKAISELEHDGLEVDLPFGFH
jgi:hypothetical protein